MDKINSFYTNKHPEIKYNSNNTEQDIVLFDNDKSESKNLSDADNQYISALLERQIGLMKKNKLV